MPTPPSHSSRRPPRAEAPARTQPGAREERPAENRRDARTEARRRDARTDAGGSDAGAGASPDPRAGSAPRTSTGPRADALERLPVRTALPALREALEQRGTAVLHAPPGTGKTTLVPPALAGLLADGAPARNVLVAEPRRLAARSAARRIAWLLGERVGESVGYTVRGERRVGPRTRVEVVTTGVLLRRLQRDPELPGTDVVLLDECHERHLDADTALAFLLDVRAALRPELRLVLASATADTDAWAELLARQEGGEPAPVVAAEGVAHPVDIAHAPPPRGAAPPHGTRVDPALLSHVAATVVRGLERDPDGDVLCFLPGVGEIARVARQLTERLGSRAEVLQLHGRAPADVQDAVLRGRGGEGPRRIVLATSVAESSLTVPGVRVVVDSGLAREPRMDHARGLGSLVTVRVSRATAVQRAGRAGREGPGVALRCWEQAEEARRQRFPSPEIALADLTDFALQTACWGDPEARTLALLDPPPAGAMAAARDTLRAIGAVDEQGRVTARGRAMAGMGLHPRLARALLDGARLTRPQLAAEVVALIGEPPPAQWGTEVSAALREARRVGERDPYGGRWRREVRRLREALRTVGTVADDGRETGPRRPLDPPEGLTEELAAGLVVALAHPERVARGRGPGSWLMASGTRAEHRSGDGGWLAVATADRPAGAATARVRLAAELDEELARLAAGALRREYTDITLDADRGQVVARRVEALGAIELRSRVEPAPEPEVVREALRTRLREQGPEVLRWTESALRLRQRLAFLHRELGPPWPDVGDDALVAAVGERLTGTSLAKVDVHAVLTSLLPWASGAAARFEELAPERVEVPSGSRVRIDYGSEQPVLAVKLQELFGWNATPRIAGGRVPLLVHLLSPAGRPAAVTADLASFWQQGYRSVRAELRGRYPRHPWPDDPTTAQPTGRVRRRG